MSSPLTAEKRELIIAVRSQVDMTKLRKSEGRSGYTVDELKAWCTALGFRMTSGARKEHWRNALLGKFASVPAEEQPSDNMLISPIVAAVVEKAKAKVDEAEKAKAMMAVGDMINYERGWYQVLKLNEKRMTIQLLKPQSVKRGLSRQDWEETYTLKAGEFDEDARPKSINYSTYYAEHKYKGGEITDKYYSG